MVIESSLEGEEMKKLGFGLMRLPVIGEDKGNIDKEEVCRMIDLFMERGFTYFDTAWFYHEKQSELAAGECLASRYPRSSFVLADKMPLDLLAPGDDPSSYFSKQLEKCRVEYFDYYLIHALKGGDKLRKAEDLHLFEFISRIKAEAKARRIGFSFHDSAEVLDQILSAHPEVDFVQLQINYLDWDSTSVQSRKVYETARRHGKDVIIMEPVKGGRLASIPQRAEEVLHQLDDALSPAGWALRFAAGLDGVIMVLSGMSTIAQVDENTRLLDDPAPLSTDERDALYRVAGIIEDEAMIGCTACSYCVDGCPQDIPIPGYFAFYNEDIRRNGIGRKSLDTAGYARIAEGHGKASSCIGCGQCESICPQGLPITRLLKDVAARFED